MKKLMTCIMLMALSCVAVGVAGCGNVYLRGEALTAAETSTMDAYQAVRRVSSAGVPAVRDTGEPPVPTWLKAYLEENFKQWRFFVRSARKDLTWGPKLPAESAVEREGE
jgi:hypothetical protein